MANAFRHRRDFRQSRTDVVVKGVGGEVVSGTLQLVWARYTTHASAYPNRYLPHGWGGEPYSSPEILTVAQAQDTATAIGDRVWGALGQLLWHTDGIAVGSTAITRFVVGDLIEVYDPVEGQSNTPYIVRDVTLLPDSTGHPVWEITVGDVQPDIIDIIRGVTVVQPIQQLLRGGGNGDTTGTSLGPSRIPSAPKQISITSAPLHTRQNSIQARDDSTVGLRLKPGYVPPGGTPATTPADQGHLGTIWDATSQTWVKQTWTSNDGRPHPNAIHLGGFTADGDYPGTFPVYKLVITAVDVEGPGSVTIKKNGTAIGGSPFTVGHNVLGTPVTFLPRVGGTAADIMALTLASTTTTPTYVVVWEA